MQRQILDSLLWIEELLPPETASAPKQGGMAYYLDSKLIMILVEKHYAGYEYKGATYPFEIWNGCILPVEYKKQSAFFLKFSFLENHPANKDWLYIPADSEEFEDQVKQFIREITKRNPLLGTAVKIGSLSKEEKADQENQKKKAPKKVKADKKRENNFLLGIMNPTKK